MLSRIQLRGIGRSRSVARRARNVLPLLVLPTLFAVPRAGRAANSPVGSQRAAPATLRVTDEVGRSVAIPQPARRIVSLAPSITETLFAIGLGDRVVGDTDYCDFPPEAKNRPHVGGVVNPNLEEIAALHPDLVLVARSINREATVHSLEQLHIAVYATDPRTVAQVLDSTQRLGELLGAGESGARAVAGFRARFDALRARVAGTQPASVLFVVQPAPLISVGRDTFLADALRMAGARPAIDTSQDWPEVSLEKIVKLQPDYLVFSSDEPEKQRRQITDLRDRPGWRDLRAMRENRVIILGEEISHPSPRLLDSIEQLAHALHPERFAAASRGGF